MARERILKVSFIGDANSLSRANQEVGRSFDQVDSRANKTAQSMQNTGRTMTRTLTPAAAAAAYAFKTSFDEFDAGVDAIRAGTGATGKALEGMTDSMKRVGGQVTQPLSQVGQTMADVAKRTGATGKPLERLTKQILDLERIGQTVTVAGVTRMFGDWSIATEDQSEALDKLFRLSQQTGVSIEDLQQQMVGFGSPLRTLGFDFDTTAAMLAKFEKEGVNLKTIMPGFRMALKNFAADGLEPAEALEKTIEEMKKAASESERTGKAFEIFGVRAGPDMAAAIREGRFDFEDLIKSMNNGKDTIASATEATTDWGDKLLMVKNRVQGVIGPVGEIGFAISGLAVIAGPALTGLGRLWEKLAISQATARTGLFGISRTAVVVDRGMSALSMTMRALPWVALVAGFAGMAKEASDAEAEIASLHGTIKEFGLESGKGADAAEKTRDEIIGLGEASLGMDNTFGMVNQELAENEEKLTALDRAYTIAKTPVDAWAIALDQARKTTQRAASSVVVFGNTKKEIKEWRDSTVASLGAGGRFFERLANKSKVSVDQIVTGFDKLISAHRDYRRNERVVSRAVGDSTDHLVKFIEERMGVDAPTALAALAGANNNEFEQIIRKWQRAGGISKATADSIIKDLDRQKGPLKDHKDRIDRVPDRKPTRFSTPGLSAANDDVRELLRSLGQMPDEVNIRATTSGLHGAGFPIPKSGSTPTARAHALMGAVPGIQSITSGYRPGDDGFHGVAPPWNAVDIGGENLSSIYNSAKAKYGASIREMILDHNIYEHGVERYYAPTDHMGSNRHVHFARYGFDGVVRRPTVFVAGEAGDERVKITPRHRMGSDGSGPVINLNLYGDVYGVDDLDSIVYDATKRAIVAIKTGA